MNFLHETNPLGTGCVWIHCLGSITILGRNSNFWLQVIHECNQKGKKNKKGSLSGLES